jgi:hypothetical protein
MHVLIFITQHNLMIEMIQSSHKWRLKIFGHPKMATKYWAKTSLGGWTIKNITP